MHIQWLGTAAAEGWPALFCQCDACRRAAEKGGRNIRMRAGALIDDVLLMDVNPDLYAQKLAFRLDLGEVRDILVTHNHADHFQPDTIEFLRPVFAHRKSAEKVRVYGPVDAIERLRPFEDAVLLTIVEAGMEFDTEKHHVTVLPAVHSAKLGKFYLIERDGKSILYAHDTDVFSGEAMDILKRRLKTPLSLASLDCTNGPLKHTYVGHMGLDDNVIIRDMLNEAGLADENTRYVCSHFSHNGGLIYDELCEAAKPLRIDVAYDGMKIEV